MLLKSLNTIPLVGLLLLIFKSPRTAYLTRGPVRRGGADSVARH